jgi:hypothetical protein
VRGWNSALDEIVVERFGIERSVKSEMDKADQVDQVAMSVERNAEGEKVVVKVLCKCKVAEMDKVRMLMMAFVAADKTWL